MVAVLLRAGNSSSANVAAAATCEREKVAAA